MHIQSSMGDSMNKNALLIVLSTLVLIMGFQNCSNTDYGVTTSALSKSLVVGQTEEGDEIVIDDSEDNAENDSESENSQEEEENDEEVVHSGGSHEYDENDDPEDLSAEQLVALCDVMSHRGSRSVADGAELKNLKGSELLSGHSIKSISTKGKLIFLGHEIDNKRALIQSLQSSGKSIICNADVELVKSNGIVVVVNGDIKDIQNSVGKIVLVNGHVVGSVDGAKARIIEK